jgi:putative membrane protein
LSRVKSWVTQLAGRGPGLVLRGACMGVADVIPGVSGGTIALITGIYDELVGTIAGLNTQVAGLALRGRLREAAERANIAFLAPLLLGVVLAIASLARPITYLLVEYPEPVWGFFTGLILASALYVARQVGRWTAGTGAWLLVGGAVGVIITSLVPLHTGAELPKFFLAGMIAIIAMILPGISGSFLLVIMGKYEQVFTAVHTRELDVLACFCGGCAVGVLLFSRLLKALLARYHQATMAFLVGLMLGSERKVWPFRQVLEQEEIGGKMMVLRDQTTWPADYTPEVWLSFGLMLAGALLVLALERMGRRP